MNALITLPPREVVYPCSDGLPMADDPKQFVWILVLYGNLAAWFRDRPDVLVGGNHLWYPLEGHSDVSAAPDVYVVFGRPKGHRPSYKQWEEDGVPLTVVFEVLSPSNTPFEMADKLAFYDEHGVEEYYAYDPEANELRIYQRGREALRMLRHEGTFTSPRLGVRFDVTAGPEMAVFYPDGQRFLTFEELKALQEQEHKGRLVAEQRATDAERRSARLGELALKASRGQASPEEVAELERLVNEARPKG